MSLWYCCLFLCARCDPTFSCCFPVKKHTYGHTKTNTIPIEWYWKKPATAIQVSNKHKNIALLISLFSSPLLSIIVKTFHAVCGNHSNLYSYISHTFASTLLSSFWFVFPRSLNLSPFSLRCWVSFRISGDFFL